MRLRSVMHSSANDQLWWNPDGFASKLRSTAREKFDLSSGANTTTTNLATVR